MNDLSHRGGCSCCPRTADVLPLDTVLYWEFGGYQVLKDDEILYVQPKGTGFMNAKTLAEIDDMIETATSKESKYEVLLELPLRGATWERKEKGKWVLTDTNQGFA